jgi:hypothetical protein
MLVRTPQPYSSALPQDSLDVQFLDMTHKEPVKSSPAERVNVFLESLPILKEAMPNYTVARPSSSFMITTLRAVMVTLAVACVLGLVYSFMCADMEDYNRQQKRNRKGRAASAGASSGSYTYHRTPTNNSADKAGDSSREKAESPDSDEDVNQQKRNLAARRRSNKEPGAQVSHYWDRTRAQLAPADRRFLDVGSEIFQHVAPRTSSLVSTFLDEFNVSL